MGPSPGHFEAILRPFWAIPGNLEATLGYLGAILGLPGAILGSLATILGRLGGYLGPSWGHPRPSWGHLGDVRGYLVAIWGHLGAILGHLRASKGPEMRGQVRNGKGLTKSVKCARRLGENTIFEGLGGRLKPAWGHLEPSRSHSRAIECNLGGVLRAP